MTKLKTGALPATHQKLFVVTKQPPLPEQRIEPEQRLKVAMKTHKEIIQRRYCQKMSEETIINLYPQYPVSEIIAETNNQLKDVLLEWLKINFGIILQTNNYPVIEIIENWLSRELIYLEI